MPLRTETLRYGPNKQYAASTAVVAPAGEKPGGPLGAPRALPAVIVVQEAWGVDEHIQDVVARLARAGYFAMAPDLFVTDGMRPAPLHRPRMQGVQSFVNKHGSAMFGDADARAAALAQLKEPLKSEVEESFTAMLELLHAPPERHLPALQAAISFLVDENEATKGQQVAVVGFCMGGGLASQLACVDAGLAGAVIFYGSAPPVDRVPSIACPMLALHGSLDARLVGQLPAFQAAMTAQGKSLEVHVYDGAPHAFFNDTRPSWHAGASRAAWARTLSFLATTLGTAKEVG